MNGSDYPCNGRRGSRNRVTSIVATETIYILIATLPCDQVYTDVQWLLYSASRCPSRRSHSRPGASWGTQ
ncbi:hypothetical protein E2L06_05140 [Haloterrigena sp. H1]|nr:hypothetical protein E2L06_05140 [Haloterrigena sp. H1]